MDSLLFDIRFQYALHTTSFKEQPVSDRTFSRFRRRCLTYETETGIDLIPANKRLADAAARLQVMQFSQYNTAGEAETLCEEVMDKLLDALREQYDYCGRSPTHRAYMISLTYRALRRRMNTSPETVRVDRTNPPAAFLSLPHTGAHKLPRA